MKLEIFHKILITFSFNKTEQNLVHEKIFEIQNFLVKRTNLSDKI